MNKLVCIIFLQFFFLSLTQSQSYLLDSLSNLSAQDYDVWAEKYLETIEYKEPELLRESLITRLAKDKYTSDDIIISLLKQYKLFESYKITNSRNKLNSENELIMSPIGSVREKAYPLLGELVDEISSCIYKRDLLEYKLQEWKIRLLSVNFEDENKIEELKEKLFLDVKDKEFNLSVSQFRRCLSLGHYYAKKDSYDFDKSESYYYKILSYPFYKLKERSEKKTMQDLYLYAAKGIMKLRKDDLWRIKNTHFYPATYHILNPIKEQYIAELENK